jgi:hypothetical protein
MQNLVEWRLAGETEVHGVNLPQRLSSTTNSTWPDPGSNPGRRGGKPATNPLSYDAAKDRERNRFAFKHMNVTEELKFTRFLSQRGIFL